MKKTFTRATTVCAAILALNTVTASLQAMDLESVQQAREERRLMLADAEQNRDAIVAQIVERLRPQAEDLNLVGWETELNTLLNKSPIDRLLQAQEVSDYRSVVHAAMGYRALPSSQFSGELAGAFSSGIGGAASLAGAIGATFIPVAPCRIVDTRGAAAGSLSPGSSRAFHLDNTGGGDISSQGGDCTLVAPEGTVGVAVNLTATGQVDRGFMTLYPEGEPLPATGSTINYVPGTNLANSTVVGTAVAAGADFRIYTLSGTNAVVDLLGYFVARDVQFLVSSAVSVSNGGGVPSPACADGYSYVGGEAEFGGQFGQGPGLYVLSVSKSLGVESALCQVFVDTGESGGAANVTCTATCMR